MVDIFVNIWQRKYLHPKKRSKNIRIDVVISKKEVKLYSCMSVILLFRERQLILYTWNIAIIRIEINIP